MGIWVFEQLSTKNFRLKLCLSGMEVHVFIELIVL